MHFPARSLRLALALTVATAAVVLAGCSSGSSVLSKEEWVKEANAICKAQRAKAAEWQQQVIAAGNDPNKTADVYDRILPEVKADSERYAELGPPEGEEKRYDQSVEYDRRQVEITAELSPAFRVGDQLEIQRLVSESIDIAKKSAALYRRLGAEECALAASGG